MHEDDKPTDPDATARVTLVPQARARSTGRFTYHNEWERLCACGHTLGHHLAEAPHDCIESDFSEVECRCDRFRPAKKGRAK